MAITVLHNDEDPVELPEGPERTILPPPRIYDYCRLWRRMPDVEGDCRRFQTRLEIAMGMLLPGFVLIISGMLTKVLGLKRTKKNTLPQMPYNQAILHSQSALREAKSFVPYVALLDLSKPEPDGLALAKQFQQMTETRKTVLIAFSGYGQPDDLERSRNAGFIHHLVKPTNPDAVHKLIKSIRSI